MKLCDSFRVAGHGVRTVLREERNFRIHLCISCYVLFFAWFAEVLDKLPILLLCIGLVLSMELANSAIESLADALRPEFDPKIGAAKDIAAGAVLFAAIFTALVGLWIFCAPNILSLVWEKLIAMPWILAVILLPLLPMYIFCKAPRG